MRKFIKNDRVILISDDNKKVTENYIIFENKKIEAKYFNFDITTSIFGTLENMIKICGLKEVM
jgi:hypothetical protein